MAPETKYARTHDGVHIAYQTVGEGSIDVVVVIGWTTNIEVLWEQPLIASFLTRLARSARLIIFDKRGVGLSDRVPEAALPSLETRMDDVRAVMDAAGSQRAVVFGISEGGPMSMLFAATYPERTLGLILFGTVADFRSINGGGAGVERELRLIERSWGTTEYARMALREWAAPSMAEDEELVGWLASYLRKGASPGAAMALERMNSQIDATGILGAIRVPALVMGRSDDRDFPIKDVRRTAEAISGARFVLLEGPDHFFFIGDTAPMLDEIDRFLDAIRDDQAELDRVLATVMFTDIVGSTEQAAEIGDRAWVRLLEKHHAVIRGQLARYRGREIDTAGDGFLAIFDGPIRAIRCALAAVAAVGELGVEIRAGLHTGEIEIHGDDVRGLAVHIGSRIASLAGASEILVSSTVKDLVAGAALRFDLHGGHVLKGVPGEWVVYRAAVA